jgi:2-polyprenyl-6-methoxyphenol hydroxylase-like FAD-dependent oxidoreductase
MDTQILGVYCLCDDLLKAMNHVEDPQCQMNDAEVMTTALVAALFFGGNHARARSFLQEAGYMPRMLTKSRFNRRWPENFLVMGDAACGFNPVYGQGMTAAALYANVLAESLRSLKDGSLPAGWSKRIQTRLARVVAGPWLLATSDDYRYPETIGRRTDWVTRISQGYMDRVLRLANHDQQVFTAFFSVIHLLRPVSYLFNPVIVLKVLRSSIW